MKNKHCSLPETDYDVKSLIDLAKKELCLLTIKASVYSILAVLSILTVIIYGSYMPVFIVGGISACAFALFLIKTFKGFSLSDYRSSIGKITNIRKDIKTVHTNKIGGINPFGARKYDQDVRNEMRLRITVQDSGRRRKYRLIGVTEKHADYYEAGGEAIHIWGTRFPVRLDQRKGNRLCPMCGEFNSSEEKTCARCKRKIMK